MRWCASSGCGGAGGLRCSCWRWLRACLLGLIGLIGLRAIGTSFLSGGELGFSGGAALCLAARELLGELAAHVLALGVAEHF